MDRISILPAPRNRVALSSPLTQIHPFPNGNGRFSRTAADLLIMHHEEKRCTLGLINLVDASATRREYIDALQAADNDALEPLLAFARS
jgi:fido (protein-threonine AMPylation protein)